MTLDRRSLLVSTNLAFKDWNTVFEDDGKMPFRE